MLRPAGAARSVAYFDALSFGETSAPVASAGGGSGPQSVAAPGGPDGAVAGEDAPGGLGAGATPFDVANVTPSPRVEAALDGDGSGNDAFVWLIGSLAVPVVGFAVIGAAELARRRDVDAH
jgi:hypothetical protein